MLEETAQGKILMFVMSCIVFVIFNRRYLSNGQTIGMRIAKTQAVGASNGENASTTTMTIRYMVLVGLSLFSFYITLINLVLLLFHPEKRTIYDLIAGTVVIDS